MQIEIASTLVNALPFLNYIDISLCFFFFSFIKSNIDMMTIGYQFEKVIINV